MKESLSDISPFNSFKVLWWRERLQQEGIPDPVTLTLDISNQCQQSCQWCFNKKYKREKPFKLRTETALKVIDDMENSSVKAVEFTGGGEPTLHCDLPLFLYRCKDRNLETALVTNGELIDETLIRAVIETCSWVRISLDAGSPMTYKELHGSSLFSQVIDNLGNLVEAKKEANTKVPEIGVTYLVHPFNINEMLYTTKMLCEIGVDYLNFRPLFSEYEEVEEELRINADSLKYNPLVLRNLEDCMQLGADNGLRVRATWHRFSDIPLAQRFSRCWCSPLNPLIRADGKMHICCERRGDESLVFGDVYEDSFWNVWGGSRHQRVLDMLMLDDCPRKCKLSKMNEICEYGIKRDVFGRNWI